MIVVTGAAGFIGRNVVAELNSRGLRELILVDDLGTDEKWKNLVGLKYDDIITPQMFLDQLNQYRKGDISGIVHLGACSATTERDADYLLRNNYRYTQTLARWCMSNEIRFVYASSAATYGDGSKGYDDNDQVTTSLVPMNMYGYSKHMFDLWALQQGYLTGAANGIVGLKYFNVYGPYEDHKGDMRSVVNKSYKQILDHGRVSLFKSYKPEYGDGEQMRDFIYVKDAVDITLHFLFDRSTSGLFNCGTGQARTWKALAEAVYSAMNRIPVIDFIDMPESLKGKYQYFTEANMSKLRSAGYSKTTVTLEEGIRDYVQQYLCHSNV